MRITIKKHHRQFLWNLASQMGCTEAEACDYIFWELKRTGFSFASSLQPCNPPSYIPPVVTEFVEHNYQAVQVDPELQRILAAGLEEF